MRHEYYLYINTNPGRNVLYVGVTNNLLQRTIEHYLQRGDPITFSGKYSCYFVVYYEEFKYINNAILREKEIKKWNRKKKEILISTMNPQWKFLNFELFDHWPPDGELFHRGSR